MEEKHIFKSKFKFPYTTLMIGYLIFLVTLISLKTNQAWITALDQWGHQSLQFLPHTTFNGIAIVITYLGQHEATIVLSLILSAFLLFKRAYRLLFFLIQNICLGNLFNHLIKLSIQRARPDLHQILPQSGFSFPSGHSANSVLLYGTILIILYYFIQKRSKRVILTSLTIVLIFLIGCSRIYLQVHYPSDVLAGWSSALGHLSLFYWFSRRFYLPRPVD